MIKGLVCNSVIEWLIQSSETEVMLERVLWIDSSKRYIVVFNLRDKNALPVVKNLDEIVEALEDNRARIVEDYDNPILLRREDEISDRDKQIRDRWWNILKDVVTNEPQVYDKKSRAKLINQALEKHDTAKKCIYQQLRRYWKSGKVKNSLTPSYYKCGGKGKEKFAGDKKRGRPKNNIDICGEGVNITEEVKKKIRAGAKLYYGNSDKLSLKQAYEKTIFKFFNIGYRDGGDINYPIIPSTGTIPTIKQFKYWIKEERHSQKMLENRFGKKEFQLRHRAVLGDSTQEAFGPGSRYQIDATIANVAIINSLNKNWIIGRPVIYAVIDVFSRLVVGIYVGLEGPSWMGAMMALANVAADKVEFCNQYDICIREEEWPSKHLPEVLTADRGELEGTRPENLVNVLNTTVENLPPYRADWKGIIEKYFDVLDNQSTPTLPGKVKTDLKQRGEKDYRLGAQLTLKEFTQIIIRCVLYHNNSQRMSWYNRDEFMIQQDVEPIPIELWNWGIENRTGKLRTINEDIVKLNLMPTDEATVTHRGIKFGRKLIYSCSLASKENWFGRARQSGSWRVPISYDPRDPEYIYIRLDNGMGFEKCFLLEHKDTFKGKYLEEIQDLIKNESRDEAKYESKELQSRANLDAEIKSIVSTAQAQHIKASISDTKRLSDIRANRALEREIQRQNESWDLGNKEKKASKQEEKDYVSPNDYIAQIKHNQNRR